MWVSFCILFKCAKWQHVAVFLRFSFSFSFWYIVVSLVGLLFINAGLFLYSFQMRKMTIWSSLFKVSFSYLQVSLVGLFSICAGLFFINVGLFLYSLQMRKISTWSFFCKVFLFFFTYRGLSRGSLFHIHRSLFHKCGSVFSSNAQHHNVELSF